MINQLIKFKNNVPTYHTIKALERAMEEIPGVIHGKEYPVTHTFHGDVYSRRIEMPKDMLIVGRMHMKDNFLTIVGDVTIWTEEGMKRLKGTNVLKTRPGVKRVIYAHEASTLITFHYCPEQDIEKVEQMIFADVDKEEQLLATLAVTLLVHERAVAEIACTSVSSSR